MKNILITGVSSGIGLATVHFFLDQGYFVYGSVRKKEEADALQKQLGDQFFPLVFDVRSNESILAAAKKVEDHLAGAGLMALVNNAGIAVSGPIQLVDLQEFEKQLDVNVMGLVRVSQAFLPMLGAALPKRANPGKIFNISSVSGLFTAPFLGPYCASKYAVEAISDAMRRELSIFGIRVVSIEPGPIQTPIWEKAVAQTNTYPGSAYAPILRSTEKLIKNSEAKSIPARRVAEVIFKALKRSSPKARYIVTKGKLGQWLLFNLVPYWLVDYFIANALQKRLDKEEARKKA